jgi:hypothetical protein
VCVVLPLARFLNFVTVWVEFPLLGRRRNLTEEVSLVLNEFQETVYRCSEYQSDFSQLGYTAHGFTTSRHTGHVTTRYMIYHPSVCISRKVKVKFRCGALFSTEALWLIVLLTPKRVPSFISRGAARQAARTTSASEGRNYSWNLANNLVIHLSR